MTEIIGYPIVSREHAYQLGVRYDAALKSLGKAHLVREFDDAKNFVETRLGPAFDYDLYASMHTRFEADCQGLTKDDQQETFVLFASELLEQFPIEILQDIDFWRYLSLFSLRNYIMRVKGDFLPSRYGGEGDGQLEKNWPLIEGLRWAWRLVYNSDPQNVRSLSVAHKDAGYSGQVRDQYISNIVRPRWASYPEASRAFLRAALTPDPIFDLDNSARRYLNKFQQKIARTSHNILFEALNEEELELLFTGLRSENFSDGVSPSV